MKNDEDDFIRHRSSDWWLFSQLVLIVLGLAFAAWVAFFAPCKSLGWMPIKDLPARCLP